MNPAKNPIMKFVHKTKNTNQTKQSPSPEPGKTEDTAQTKLLLNPEPEKTKDTTQTKQPHNHSQDKGISNSTPMDELDPQVLAALPEDIRKEVLAQYNIKSQDGVVKYTNTPLGGIKVEPRISDMPQAAQSDVIATSQEPGPSHGRRNFPERKETFAESGSLSDMSFSQIDEGVLQELPEELRDEITAHFKENKRSVEVKPIVESVFPTLMRNSPKKKTSPEKKAVKGKKRGRPKKCDVTPAKKGSSTRSIVPSTSNASLAPTRTLIKPQDNNGSSDAQIKQTSPETESMESKQNIEATFCGKSRLEDIRPLVKEWLASTNLPFDEDISLMSDFLEAMVSSKKIHLVSIIIKCIQRNILKLEDSEGWKKGFGSLVSKVQTRMMEYYGNPLAISKEF